MPEALYIYGLVAVENLKQKMYFQSSQKQSSKFAVGFKLNVCSLKADFEEEHVTFIN